ncbi:MAG TPA: c-type cytochrome domain-containing protein, partial [Pirellulales bacterium]|nr:c-type cytochrome domain-containing protein [Pirellulales bacterium]
MLRVLSPAVLLIAILAPRQAIRADDAGIDFFEKKIRPLLVEHCYGCHSASAKKLGGGLLLDHRKGLLRGGDSGAAIEPGKPEASLLITAVRYADDAVQMPPKGKLPA